METFRETPAEPTSASTGTGAPMSTMGARTVSVLESFGDFFAFVGAVGRRLPRRPFNASEAVRQAWVIMRVIIVPTGLVAIPLGAFDDPFFASPAFSVWEERKHDWVEISGEQVEHLD